MPALKHFTLTGRIQAVVSDSTPEVDGDPDTDPDINGIHASLTATPFVHDDNGKPVSWRVVKAAALTPHPAVILLQPIRGRMDNGILKRNAAQTDLRLVAQCSALALPAGHQLGYEITFQNATFDGGPQTVPAFKFYAPTVADGADDAVGGADEVIVDIATVTWI